METPKIPPHGIFINRNPHLHRIRHSEIHNRLIELIKDFCYHTGKHIDRTTAQEIIEWSYKQTQTPDEESAE